VKLVQVAVAENLPLAEALDYFFYRVDRFFGNRTLSCAFSECFSLFNGLASFCSPEVPGWSVDRETSPREGRACLM
jgi:hypothetical protein